MQTTAAHLDSTFTILLVIRTMGTPYVDVVEKREQAMQEPEKGDESLEIEMDGPNLKRTLTSRQISMFSIAGSIGTGLLISTGSALAAGGPGSMLIAFTVVGFLCYNVLAAYGEMSTAFPMDKSFSGYAARFVDPAYG